jgi:DNA-binding MarR family transcriptional regulator
MERAMKSGLGDLDLTGTGACAAFNLKRAARTVTQSFDEALAAAGLRSTQFAILVAAAKNQPVSIGELASLTLSDPTTMTRNVRLMAREGLIAVPARGPKREKRVTLTAKGARALAQALPHWRAAQARFVDAFGGPAWKGMQRDLERAARLAARG